MSCRGLQQPYVSVPSSIDVPLPYAKGVPSLPPEMLDSVVACLLSKRHAFPEIAAFSLVSRQFREVALRGYFTVLEAQSAKHWAKVCQIAWVPSWARHLKASSSCLQSSLDALQSFTSLQSLELDFSSDGLSTQSTRCLLIFKNLVANLKTLKLTSLPRVDTALLSLVGSHCPSLTTLELSSIERLDEECCWLCFQESSSCIIHSPIPDVFPSVDHLARAFGKALQPLNRLEHLFLGIFLSDADVLIRHFDRCAAVVISSPRTGFYSLPPFGPDKCVICVTEHAAAVQNRERMASDIIGNVLPSLKTIGWSSYFPYQGSSDGTAGKATVFCTRAVDEKADLKR